MAESIPSPKSILRGHKAQVHAATFIRNNERLITGDAEGFVVLWDLTIMRPRAVWRAHGNAILDNKLIVWKLGVEDEERLGVSLPLEDVPKPRPQPWVLHILEVNTMNFCSFAACPKESDEGFIDINSASEIIIAVPNTLASEALDIYTLPTQARLHTIKPGQGNGMAMSLSLFHHRGNLTLIGAFENGFASVHRLEADGSWTMTYRSQAHSQPILSIDLHPDCESFFTSSADSIIAKHPVPISRQEVSTPLDPNQRVVELDEPQGSYSSSLLSEALGQTSASENSTANKTLKEWEHPIKAVNTKHSGQQSLKVRSDGKIFATAGWDSRIRVYSAKTLKELAVLHWHKVGAYAVAFSTVEAPNSQSTAAPTAHEVSSDGNDQAKPLTRYLTRSSPRTNLRVW
ncbi:ASTRA-associated protein 1 [Cladobotryum mycophilum]|uniref:ASTRA-associated protein 1 n=1 Tax=Cladobotryum mycophilum TaxID=491253 RepID=A0ABR0SY77_9HYPO